MICNALRLYKFVFGYWADVIHDGIAGWKQEREKEKIRNRYELVLKPNTVIFGDKSYDPMSIFCFYMKLKHVTLVCKDYENKSLECFSFCQSKC